jgi:hypothetical protein
MRRETNGSRFRKTRNLEIGLNLVSGSIALCVRAGQATERRWKSGARLAVRPRFLRHGVEEAERFAQASQLTE